ncbi:MAG: hypothetical protein FJZ85_06545 [Chloroflexi bacterium]|nr:hypothetical protein [Chloroflexota bacterium]
MAPKTKRKSTLDKAIREIEHGNAWDESDEVVQVDVKKPLDKIILSDSPRTIGRRLEESEKA